MKIDVTAIQNPPIKPIKPIKPIEPLPGPSSSIQIRIFTTAARFGFRDAPRSTWYSALHSNLPRGDPFHQIAPRIYFAHALVWGCGKNGIEAQQEYLFFLGPVSLTVFISIQVIKGPSHQSIDHSIPAGLCCTDVVRPYEVTSLRTVELGNSQLKSYGGNQRARVWYGGYMFGFLLSAAFRAGWLPPTYPLAVGDGRTEVGFFDVTRFTAWWKRLCSHPWGVRNASFKLLLYLVL